MAYITSERVAEIRKELKAAFPGYKFSVTRHNCSAVYVCIMEAPVKFTDRPHQQLNPSFLDSYENSEILKQIKKIANEGNYNNSDSMSDYFDVGFYLNIHVGKWDKPFKLTA